MVLLCPKLVKAFKHGYFIPKIAFMPCLNSSCAPFIALDTHRGGVGDPPHF